MSTITKLEVNLAERYIPPEPTPEEPEEGSEEWCQDHLEDPRCEQYRPVDPDDPVDPTPEEPEEGSEEWCQDHLEDPRCEQYRPVDPDDPVDPTPEEPEEGSEEWCEIHTDSELCKEQEEDNEETGDAPDTGHHTIVSVGDNNNTPTSTPFIVAGAAIALLVLVACFVKFFKHKKEDKNHYYFKQQKGYKKAYATILPVLSLALIAGIFARVFAYNYDVYPDLTASKTLTIDNADIIGTDEIRYVKDTLVLPKSNYGYELYIHADNNKLTSYNQGIYLDPVASTGALTENTFGYTFVNPATNPNTFERLSQTAERIITKAYSPEQTKDGISLDIWWGVNAKSAEEANYELEVYYDLHEQQVITELQDMTPEICADMPTNHFESFIDIRNNKTYQVYKDDFGRCNIEGTLTHDEDGNPIIEPISKEQFAPEESICPTGWHEVTTSGPEAAEETTGCVADYDDIKVTIFDIDEDGNIIFNEPEVIDLDDERCEGWTCTFIAPAQPEGAEPGQEFYGWSTEIDPEIIEGQEKEGKYQPGEDIVIDSPDFVLYPIWEKKTPKALLTDNNVVNFVYDYYQKSEIESDKDGYKTNYEIGQDNNALLAIYDVPENSTSDKSFLPAAYGQDYGTKIQTLNFDESFKDFTPTSTRSWFKELYYVAGIVNPENLNMSKVSDAGSMFYSTSGKGDEFNLDLSAWDVSSVVDAICMFYRVGGHDTKTTKLNLSGWNLQSIERIDSMFGDFGIYGAYSSDGSSADEFYLNASGWNLGNLESTAKMFAWNNFTSLNYNTGKIEIDLSGWKAKNLKNTSEMFKNLGDNTKHRAKSVIVDVSDWEADNITNQNWMFSSIPGERIFKMSNWKIPAEANVENMFSNSHTGNLTIEGLSTWHLEEATNLDELFAGCTIKPANIHDEVTGTDILDLSAWNTNNVESMSGMFFEGYGGITVANGKNVVIDLTGWNTSKVENMSGMFRNLKVSQGKQLEVKGIEKFDTSSVTNFEYMFSGFSPKDSDGNIFLDLSEKIIAAEDSATGEAYTAWNLSNAKNLEGMFQDFVVGDGSVELNISNWKTQNVENMSYLFKGNTLSSEKKIIGFNSIKTTNVTNMSSMFSAFDTTDDILDLTFLDTSNVIKMASMFSGINVHNINISSFNVDKVTDTTWMFSSARLQNIYVPSGTDWATKATKIQSSTRMFSGATNLPNYNASRTDVSAAHIGDVDGIMGYFTDVCEKDNSCGEVQEQQGQQTEQRPPLMSYSPSSNYSYTPISEQSIEESTDESETEKPVSTSEEKKSTKKSDTKSEQTEPLGVEKSVEKASTVDTATIAVIVASFVLVSAGAVIIFLIEKRRNEDEE